MNFKKIKHGFFFQVGQLDNPETVGRDSSRSRRNPWFFRAHFWLPRVKNQCFFNSCGHILISLRNLLRSDFLGGQVIHRVTEYEEKKKKLLNEQKTIQTRHAVVEIRFSVIKKIVCWFCHPSKHLLCHLSINNSSN